MEISIFLLAIVPPFLYALTNHIDNILLEKYFKEGGVGTLMLFSAFLAAIALPILFFMDPTVLEVSVEHRWYLAAIGLTNTILLWAYLKALFIDEPTVVITYYQLVPVIALVLSYIVLGETISQNQSLAMLLIISGALVLTYSDNGHGKMEFRWATAGYMVIASFCWALESTIFKLVALEENPTRSFFWEHVSLLTIGFLMFAFIKKYRQSFLKALKFNSAPILGLNIFNESLYISGNYVAALVVVLIPVSLTLLMNSFQPLFVLVIGIILTFLFPKLKVEHVNSRNIPQKLIAIALTGIGVLMLGV